MSIDFDSYEQRVSEFLAAAAASKVWWYYLLASTSVLGSFKREISKLANFAHYNDFNLLTVNFAAILAIFQVSKLCTTFAGQELCCQSKLCHLSIGH